MSCFINASLLDKVSADSVVIGRGRAVKQHPGNVRFQAIIRSHLDSYSNAPTKTQKSKIILMILKEVRSADNADFVKLVDGVYRPIEESAARITIAQNIRDDLSESYKSSRQHKQHRRYQRKQASVFQARQAFPLTTLKMDMSFPRIQPLATQQLARAVSYGSSSMACTINDILREAVELAQCHPSLIPVADNKPSVVEQETEMGDSFSSLFEAFAPSAVASPAQVDSPFEPTPLFDDSGSYGSLEDDWEPFPLVL